MFACLSTRLRIKDAAEPRYVAWQREIAE